MDFSKERMSVKLLLDVSQTELFINDGELVMTNLVFPEKNMRLNSLWKMVPS